VQPETVAPGAASAWCGVKQTLDSHCTACHNEQKVAGAPMSLKTYADTQLPAVSDPTKKVYQLVGTRVHDVAKPMPPQDKLMPTELSGIDTWVQGGGLAGADPTCAGSAPAPATADTWSWPTNCDGTYKILSHGAGGDSDPYVVPAGQEVHPSIAVTAPWGSEEVQMIAWRAITDNPKVLHHWILYSGSREHIVGWAPGKEHNANEPDDVGMHMPGGSYTLDMHYNNLMGTTDGKDNSGVEVCVLKKANFRPKTAAVYSGFSSFNIAIPAHSTAFDVTANCDVAGSQTVTLLSASPHAHKLANHMKFTVVRASGETIVMHDGSFDFNEQASYPLDKPIDLKMGDKVVTTCTFSNPGNSTVTFGEDTGNEMCFNFATYYPMNMLSCGGAFAGLPGGAPMIPGF
jgi:hypothetical protein